MRITTRDLKRIIREELQKSTLRERVGAGRLNRLKIQVNNEWKKNKDVDSAVSLIDDMDNVDEETQEKLMDYLFDRDRAGPQNDPRTAPVTQDDPESTALAKAKQQYLTHDPVTGAAVRRTAGEDITVVSAGDTDFNYTSVMGDLLGGKKVLKVGMGGNAYKESGDLEKRKTWAQIKIIQDLLVKGGWAKGLFTSSDGDFGGRTKQAVINMQNALKLSVDGVVGRQSSAALDPRKVDQAPNIPITGQEIDDTVQAALLDIDLKPPEEPAAATAQQEGLRRWGVLAGILKG